MKITKVETFKYWIEWCNWLFVKVSTDEGLYGWGEGSLHGPVASVETAVHELGATLIGQDPAGVEAHWQDERPLRDQVSTNPVRFNDGHFELPTGPGWGTDLDLQALETRPFRPQPASRSRASLWR